MNTPLIESALTEVYGPRCDEHMAGCDCCNAWHELDTLKAQAEQKETNLGPVAQGLFDAHMSGQAWPNYKCSDCLYEWTGPYPGPCPDCGSKHVAPMTQP